MSADLISTRIPFDDGGGDGVMKPGTLHSLDDVIAWVYSHEALFEERWKNQVGYNNSTDTKTTVCQTFMQTELKELRLEVQSMRKLIYIAMGMVMFVAFIAPMMVTFFHHGG